VVQDRELPWHEDNSFRPVLIGRTSREKSWRRDLPGHERWQLCQCQARCRRIERAHFRKIEQAFGVGFGSACLANYLRQSRSCAVSRKLRITANAKHTGVAAIMAALNNGYRLTNASSRLAVDATTDTPAPGTSIAQATPTGNTAQVWVIR
jgi:hypothetical protein